jgi:hypothetical protein
VTSRIAFLAILGLAPVALLLLWPKVRDRFTTAEVSLAVVRQPREEVLVSGRIMNSGTTPFSLQTLLIEEPGQEPYHRVLSLNAENAFELTLGKPVPGSYRASLLIDKSEADASAPAKLLTTPPLILNAQGASPLERVKARDYDRPRLLAVAGMCAAVWAVLLGVCTRACFRPALPLGPSPEQVSSG